MLKSTTTLAISFVATLLSLASIAQAVPVIGGTGPGGVATTATTSDLKLWLSAETITGLSDGQNLTTWTNRVTHPNASGNAGVANTPPTYETGGSDLKNGLPVVDFSGASSGAVGDVLSGTAGTGGFTAAKMMFFVGRQDTFVNGCCNSGIATGSDSNGITSQSGVYSTDWGGAGANGGSPNQLGDWTIASAMYNQTTNNRTRIWIDGAGDFTNSAGTNRGGTATDYRLGARRNDGDGFSRFYDGQIGEAIIFNNLLNDAERIVVENYLSAKWDIAMTANDLYAGDGFGFDFNVFGVANVGGSLTALSTGTGGFGIEVGGLSAGQSILAGSSALGTNGMSAWYLDTSDPGAIAANLTFDISSFASDFSLIGPSGVLNITPTINGSEATYAISAADLIDGVYRLGVVPEPSTALLLVMGLCGFAARRRNHRKGIRRTNIQQLITKETAMSKLLTILTITLITVLISNSNEVAAVPLTVNTGPGGFEVTDAASDLVLWFDAGDASTFSFVSGNQVNSWTSKAFGGVVATRNGGVTLTRGTGSHGQSTVDSTGANFFTLSSAVTLPITGTGSSALVMAKTADTANGHTLLSQNGANVQFFRQDATPRVHFYNNAVVDVQVNDGSVTTDRVRYAQFSGGVVSSYLVNEVSPGFATSNDVAGTQWTLNRLGGGGGCCGNWNGDISEVIMFNRQLTAAERVSAANYMASKYGLPLAANDLYAGDTAGNGDFDLNVFGVANISGSLLSNAGMDGFGVEAPGLGIGESIYAGNKGAKTWYVDVTGSPSAADFGFAAPAFHGNGELSYSATENGNYTLLSDQFTRVGDTMVFSLSAGALVDGYFRFNSSVPEPSTAVLLGMGLVGLAARRKRK